MCASIHIHYTRILLICQENLAVFAGRVRKIVILNRFFKLVAGVFGKMQGERGHMSGRGEGFVVKTRFSGNTFFGKGLAFLGSLWYNSEVRIHQYTYPWHSWIARQTPTLKVEGSNPFG